MIIIIAVKWINSNNRNEPINKNEYSSLNLTKPEESKKK